MLNLMRYHPSAVGRDFTDWVVSGRTRMESAVKALMDPHVADRLKEGYLNYVTYYATDTGIYFVADTDIEIREYRTCALFVTGDCNDYTPVKGIAEGN